MTRSLYRGLLRVDEATENLAELGLSPTIWVADKGHHCGENLAGIAERGLIPLVSCPHPSGGAAGFRREDFSYDPERDTFVCPAGALLKRLQDRAGRQRYRAAGKGCCACAHFGVCTKDRRGRQVQVSGWEAELVANRERVHSEAARPLLMIRRQRGERPFSYYKQYGGMARMMGRGESYAAKKNLLAATGWNLLLLVKQALREAADGLVGRVGRRLWRQRVGGRRQLARWVARRVRWPWMPSHSARRAALSAGC